LLLFDISYNFTEIALDAIFNEQTGLFKFLQITLQKNETLNYKTSLQEAFNALQFIMDLCQHEYKFYILKTSVILNKFSSHFIGY
jgi:hypothetical protein